MEMKDGLPGIRAYVVNGAVAAFELAFAGQFCRHELAVTDDLGIGFVCLIQANDVLLGNYEYMSGGLRPDVFKDKRPVIFIDFF